MLYQVAFGKRLATVYGATAYAVSAVLAAFMGGLALGSWIGGRYGGRVRRPLLVYGLAEATVGVVCALTPLLFEGLAWLYVAAIHVMPGSLPVVSAVRMALTGVVVVVPTVAMGVTLPLLARVVAGQVTEADAAKGEAAARGRLGLLYAVNTAGGALGAVLGAYAILPLLGTNRTMRAAAVVNVAIGMVAVWLGRRPEVEAAAGTPAQAHSAARAAEARPAAEGESAAIARPERRLLVGLAVASGTLVFAAEVVDTHLLALLIGNSAYAFGLMLAVFLSCLSVGAAVAGSVERRAARAALPLSLCATAVALLVTLPLWDQLPRLFLVAGPRVSSWAGREIVRAIAALGMLVLPTMCMGLTFPLLLRRAAGRSDVSQLVGRLTAVNTLGSIVGSLATGYFVLPLAGSQWTLRAIALAFAACGVVAARVLRGPRGRLALATLAGSVAAVVLMPGWDLRRMTNGANVYFDAPPPPDRLEFVREDVHGGLTSVALRGTVHTLYTNGKFQGDDGAELVAQSSFAHFPALFVPRFDRALVIGLGTGTTLGTIASYPFARIDVAETSPAIVEAARRFFAGPNRGSIDDARVHLELNDGRNLLLLSSEPYDLITIELTSVWFAGAANLYSREFYQLCAQRLAAGGILQQWVQLHHIRQRELAVVLRTLRAVFPHVALFVAGRQGIAVASAEPLVASRQRLLDLGERAAIRATLGQTTGRNGEGPLATLVEHVMLSGPELDRFVADAEADGGAIVSTDENLYLEYATPRGNVLGYDASLDRTLELLERYRVPQPFQRHLGP